MKKDIIISGVGGQGIVSIAAIIGYAAVEEGLSFKQSEVHGMSQRGGDVSSHFRLSSEKIYSDLIPYGSADLIISVEPMEALRYLPYLAEDGWLITNTKPYENITNYPEIGEILSEIKKVPNNIAIDADQIAKSIGSPKSANVVILGCASAFLDIDYKKLENAIKLIFRNKGEEIVSANLTALSEGRKIAIG
jgi:indolepyruvate ferredoxin oxidoreductase beta subunit